MWLQNEVQDGTVIVSKVLGTENPSDLGTKILNAAEITERLEGMNLEAQWENWHVKYVSRIWALYISRCLKQWVVGKYCLEICLSNVAELMFAACCMEVV